MGVFVSMTILPHKVAMSVLGNSAYPFHSLVASPT